jgi:hypothetical protein
VCVILALMVLRKKMQQNKVPVGPILMLSYKNHALEEFLCDVLRGAPQLRPGQLVRCGKVEAPELQDYSERNSQEERAAETEVHRCVVVQRNARSAMHTWGNLARNQEFAARDAAGLVLKALELLARLTEDAGSADESGELAPGTSGRPIADLFPDLVDSERLPVGKCSSLASYENMSPNWIEDAKHWREVFTKENLADSGRKLVPNLLVRWLGGETPPPRCQSQLHCMAYVQRGQAYCTQHKCSAAGCGGHRSAAVPYCRSHLCLADDADGPCQLQRHAVGGYCEQHACPGCILTATHDPTSAVHRCAGPGHGSCQLHRCQVKGCTGLMLAPARYCAEHLCVACCEAGTFDGLPRLSSHPDLCVDHACLVENCPQAKVLSVDGAEYCHLHLCRLCVDVVDCSSAAAQESLLCSEHRCDYSGYVCGVPVLERNDELLRFCAAHTCQTCYAEGAADLTSPVVEDFPRNFCAAHFGADVASDLEYTGICHGVTTKGANCKAKCPEQGQLYCAAHEAQAVPTAAAGPIAAAMTAEHRAARQAECACLCGESLASLLHDESVTRGAIRQFAIARCVAAGCRVSGIALPREVPTWQCALHCSHPTVVSTAPAMETTLPEPPITETAVTPALTAGSVAKGKA